MLVINPFQTDDLKILPEIKTGIFYVSAGSIAAEELVDLWLRVPLLDQKCKFVSWLNKFYCSHNFKVKPAGKPKVNLSSSKSYMFFLLHVYVTFKVKKGYFNVICRPTF